MKNVNLLLMFLGGAAVGAIAGLLLAPESGTEMRARLCKMLQDKGIYLSKEEMERLVEKVAEKIKDVKESLE